VSGPSGHSMFCPLCTILLLRLSASSGDNRIAHFLSDWHRHYSRAMHVWAWPLRALVFLCAHAAGRKMLGNGLCRGSGRNPPDRSGLHVKVSATAGDRHRVAGLIVAHTPSDQPTRSPTGSTLIGPHCQHGWRAQSSSTTLGSRLPRTPAPCPRERPARDRRRDQRSPHPHLNQSQSSPIGQ
jgi:hypothetical protein